MKEFLCDSVFFGVAISILAYELGVFLKKKLKLAVFNPLLISIVAVIVFLVAFHIPYESYKEGAKYLSYLLTPATVCLAIPLYEQFELLKQNVAADFARLISGVLTSVICVLVLSLLFHFDHAQYVTLLPKSATTGVGMGISRNLAWYVTTSVAVIIITGIIGSVSRKRSAVFSKLKSRWQRELRSDHPHMHLEQQRHWNLERSKVP